MALGEIQWLQFKTKRTRERDAREYEQWAFPFGNRQRDMISKILKELLPNEDEKVALVCFLTAKEIVSQVHQIMFLPEHHAYAYASMLHDFTRYKRMFRPKETRSLYCALAVADLEIDENLDYPSAEELQKRADEFENEFKGIDGK